VSDHSLGIYLASIFPMHLNQRLVAPLLVCVAAVSMIFVVDQALQEVRALQNEVERQARVLAESQQPAVEQVLQDGSARDLQVLVDRFQNHGQLAGMAIFDEKAQPLAITSGLAPLLEKTTAAVRNAVRTGQAQTEYVNAKGGALHVFALPVASDLHTSAAIGIYHNVAFILAPVWHHALTGVAQTVLIVSLTLLVVRWAMGKHLRHMTRWLRDLRTGNASTAVQLPTEGIFEPLASEVTQLASSLRVARAAAEEEARLREASLSIWTPERLRIAVEGKLNGSRLFAVSNREPYEHTREGAGIKCSVPPSGLVTALEPVLCACDGTWVAQATGDADRETSDDRGRLRVPPDHPQYGLRRVWLSQEEQEGFYFGFANEGLWPLCHIAHTRPMFRAEDWKQYQAVNQKFAMALLDEMAGEKEPFVLVQDYHFALLPRIVKERRPDARVALFWHIPWPNPEALGICPWQRELLDGMLGADLIGFHIQAHCNNFLSTVDRALESRVDWEHFDVSRRGHSTKVRPFPISVAFTGERSVPNDRGNTDRAALLRQLGVTAEFLGVGVDRVDYTKGIVERFRAIERLLELFPAYREKLTFVQIGAPSRGHIRRYQDLMAEVEGEAERINASFRTASWRPIVFLKKHHSHAEILPYYREADFCMVTSLHDGMNLVAKEFVASRPDEKGVLILSRFAGASHELADALLINPYDADELAQAIHRALNMPVPEQQVRMAHMRAMVQEHNVYRWAGNLISELAGVRLERLEMAAQPAASHPLPQTMKRAS
jgi:trehalose-6-phosphate synthase